MFEDKGANKKIVGNYTCRDLFSFYLWNPAFLDQIKLRGIYNFTWFCSYTLTEELRFVVSLSQHTPKCARFSFQRYKQTKHIYICYIFSYMYMRDNQRLLFSTEFLNATHCTWGMHIKFFNENLGSPSRVIIVCNSNYFF